MNNPFAPQPSPAPTAPNPFAPSAPPSGVAAIQATAFAPLNPPGEAGLGGPPGPQEPSPQNPFSQKDLQREADAARAIAASHQAAPAALTPPAEPAAAKRSRKPRAKADAAPTPVGTAVVDGHEVTVYTPAGDEDYAVTPPDLSKVSTEDLREALKSRGWTVTLTDG